MRLRRQAMLVLSAALLPALIASARPAMAELAVLQAPFTCEVARGGLVVKPQPGARLPIAGPREERTVRLCRPTRAGQDCRTIVAHRFQVRCGADRIPWAEVAAAIVASQGGRAILREGRLRLAAQGRAAVALGRACSQAISDAADTRGIDPICEAVWEGMAGAELAFPQGFAPVGEIGARFLASAPHTAERDRLRAMASASIGTAPPRATAPPASESRSGDPAATATGVEDDAGTALSVPVPLPLMLPSPLPPPPPAWGGLPSEQSFAGAFGSGQWLTLVEIERPSERGSAAGFVMLIAAASLLSALAWTIHRLWTQREVPIGIVGRYEVILRPDMITLAKPDAQMCGELCKSAQSLLHQIAAAVADLKGAPALRRILVRETQHLEAYLGQLIQLSPVEPLEWRRMRARLQRVVSDLMRLRDIVEAAGRSAALREGTRHVPQDRDEAYAVLGANPAVELKLQKKLVDALRANWHPDHAVDERDRLLREERIKEINIAWDLVSGARAEA